MVIAHSFNTFTIILIILTVCDAQKTFAETQFNLDPNLESEEVQIIDLTPPPPAKVASTSTVALAQSQRIFYASTPVIPRARPFPPLPHLSYVPQQVVVPPRQYAYLPRTQQQYPPQQQQQFSIKTPQSVLRPPYTYNPQYSPAFTLPNPPLPGSRLQSSALHGTSTFNGTVNPRKIISSASLWFNETHPLAACTRNFSLVATEFKRKFPTKFLRDVEDKKLAELIEQRLVDCDSKSRNDHWMHMLSNLPKAKLSPSEDDECRSGMIQERIACINLISFTCQFIQRNYVFRLVPARVIIQEARLAEDGIEKCRKVLRHMRKHDHPKK